MNSLFARGTAAVIGALCAGLAPGAMAADIAALRVGTPHEAFFAVDFDGETGYIVGAAGTVLRSTDGGVTWARVKQKKTQLALLDISVEGDDLVAVGQLGKILVRSGEAPWQLVDTGTPMRLLAVDENASGAAVAVGQFGTILVSTDEGKSWKPVAPDWTRYSEMGFAPQLYDVTLDDAGVTTVVGEFGYVLRSTDLGKTWKLVRKGGELVPTLNGMVLQPGGLGYAVGQVGTVLKTTDGGLTWSKVSLANVAGPPVESNLLSVAILDDGRVLISGIRAMLIGSPDGSRWQQLTAGDISISWYVDVSPAGGDQPPIAVGHSGKIIQISGIDGA